MYMLDPEELTLMQWFGICVAGALIVFFICRYLDLYYQPQLLQVILPFV